MSEVQNKDIAQESSPKKSPTKKEIDTASLAVNHFAQGKRHLLVNDIPSAVNSLQESCRLLAEQFGETAYECADAYYYYGRALLELARIESGVLGNALDGVPEGDDLENSQVENPDKMTEETEEDEPQEEGENEEEEEEGGEGGEDVESQTQDGESQEGETTTDDEDVTNLQLAWEMLELAKLIYNKHDDKDTGLKLAQVHLKLGEVSLETENYDQSIEDLKECLKIQQEKLSPDDRCLAETHYQLGVAHSFCDNFDSATESFNNAAQVITQRINKLKEKIEEKKNWTKEQRDKEIMEKEDAFYTEENEIEELSQLLPEINEKVADMDQMKKDSKERLMKAKEAAFASLLGGQSASKACTSAVENGTSANAFGNGTATAERETKDSNKPVSNISHLVRKKRKSQEDKVEEQSKKSKLEDGTENKKETNGTHNEEQEESMDTKESEPIGAAE